MWTKHFSVIKTTAPVPTIDRSQGYSTMTSRTSSWLNIAYQGNPQRIPRYYQFQEMDSDSDINTALDTIADFCTQSEEQSDEPFDIKYNGDPNESETKIIKQMLDRWIKLNSFRSRLWYMFRDCIKNGDAFFLRDPETNEWLWLDHFMVELVKVDETKGKVPDEYIIRGLDYNRQAKFGSQQADPNAYRTPFGTATVGGARPMASGTSGPAAFNLAGSGMDQRQRGLQGPYAQELSVVDAKHVVHLSLSIGNDINWPFGSSILEPVFKTYKQKELLEDATIIYRVQRAPERRIFYIDVGTMPPERAKRHIESIKNDIHQRRIPNRTGTGGSVLDAAYNPLCMALSTMIPLIDGRVLSLDDLIMEYHDGKENWVHSCNPVTGEITSGPITWAGVTRQDTEVVCVTLDNGGVVIVTPDHKFPTLGGKLVPASELTPVHELIARERFSKQRADGKTIRTGHGPDYMIVHPLEVVELKDKIDVGTITVDKEEKYHPFHNFAISENIFLQNSINDDYFFACLQLDTKILLLDGRSLALRELIDEHQQGKENWVYSQNTTTFELEPGRITWAGVTRKDAEMVRVTLDNGEYIDVTPDHRFIARDGSEIEAGDLKDGQSLMPLYLRYGRTGPRQKNAGYTRYLCNATGKTKFVHMTMCPKPPGRAWVVHHKDFNGENNNPTNLEAMTFHAHKELHHSAGTYSLNRQWNDPEARAKIIAGMRKLYDEASPEFMARLQMRNSINGRNTWDLNEDGRAELIEKIRLGSIRSRARYKLNYSPEMFARLVELFDAGHDSVKKMCVALKGDELFRNAFQTANSDVLRDKGRRAVGLNIDDGHLNGTVAVAGYSSWGDFKINYHRNHKVTSVELLPYREDTGDITIETASGSHIFALASGIYVHNSSSDGRGSKVETLPGGESTGEIGDLTFFSKKLGRGLRIPLSYLSFGDDEQAATFNDGKLGAAMIQEYRFSKYCMRLQSLLAPKFDYEFKRFLLKNGIEIESNLFELQFNPPQSFTRYRQIELDSQRIAVYQGVADNKKLAERFKFKRFLGMSEDEMRENEELWSEENADKLKKKTGSSPAEAAMGDGLSAVGIHPESGDMDMGMGDLPEEAPADGTEAPGGGAGGAPAGGGAMGAGAPGAAPAAGGPAG